MANEINVGAEETIKNSEVVEEATEEVETEDGEDNEAEEKEEVPKERAKLSDEAQLAIHEREAKKLKRKLGIEVSTEEKPKSKTKKSDELDEGQLAYLVAKGIDNDEDIDFAQAELKKFGGTLRELLSNEYFQAKLKTRKEARAVAEATPSTSKRSGKGATDETEFHYARYQKEGSKYLQGLPREMREKLVNMRLKKEADTNQFTDVPVVGN